MNEIRTWILKQYGSGPGMRPETGVRGAILADEEEVKVIELEPVLDLLERAAFALEWSENAKEVKNDIESFIRGIKTNNFD